MDCLSLDFYYNSKDLSRDAKVVFAFSPPTKSALDDTNNRIAWQVFNLKSDPNSNQTCRFTVDYPGRWGFNVVQERASPNVILPGPAIELKRGQSTDLIVVDSDRRWSNLRESGGTQIHAHNKTDKYQAIYVSTMRTDEDIIIPSPTFVFGAVGAGGSVVADLSGPLLMMYVNIHYDEKNNLITSDLEDSLFWKVKFSTLSGYSKYKFAEEAQGSYSVTPVSGLPDEDEDIVVVHPVISHQMK
ncbi:hypothetical protein L218DRAFT_1006933 [Marasmius fiardii PR-910]|nr:hypothetical protein L218DRAFT_1006933 [Marasmius fiardii PR-910]